MQLSLPQRYGIAALVLLGILLLLIPACGRSPVPLPEGPQTIKGLLQRADLSLTRRGTHVLLKGDEPVYYVESATVSLRPLENRVVELQGTLEHNTDPKDLPVLLVTKVIGGLPEERRAWTIPSLGVTFDVPKSWNGAITKSVAQFTVSGAQLPALRVVVEDAAALPFDFRTLTTSGTSLSLRPIVIGTRKAVAVENATRGSYVIYVDLDPALVTGQKKVLAFVFSIEPGGDVPAQQEASLGIARTLRFKATAPGTRPVSGTGASADGQPCGGPAGVLCPAGHYCQVTDAATDIGVCKRI